MNLTEASMARNETHLNHLHDIFEHFELKCLEAVLMKEQVIKMTRSTQTERPTQREIEDSPEEMAPIPVVEAEPGQHIPIGLRQLMVRPSTCLLSKQNVYLFSSANDQALNPNHRLTVSHSHDLCSHQLLTVQATYPLSKRIMSQQALEKLVIRIFLKKVAEDKVQRRDGQPVHNMSETVYDFLNETYVHSNCSLLSGVDGSPPVTLRWGKF